MKKYLSVPVVFTPGNAGVGTVKTNINNFDIRKLIAIINQTREQLIYGIGTSGFGFSAVNGDTITLDFDTSTHSSTDVLLVIYDSTNDYPINVDSSRSNDLLAAIQRLVKISESLQVVDSAQRQRITIDAALPAGANTIGAVNIASAQTLATVTTVSSVTNVASVAGMDREQYINIARQTYANAIRSNLRIQ